MPQDILSSLDALCVQVRARIEATPDFKTLQALERTLSEVRGFMPEVAAEALDESNDAAANDEVAIAPVSESLEGEAEAPVSAEASVEAEAPAELETPACAEAEVEAAAVTAESEQSEASAEPAVAEAVEVVAAAAVEDGDEAEPAAQAAESEEEACGTAEPEAVALAGTGEEPGTTAEEAATAGEPAEATSEPDGEPAEEIMTVLPGEIAATAEQVATTH
jgi:hypothetical protein